MTKRILTIAAALSFIAGGCKSHPKPAPPSRQVAVTEFSHPLPPGTFPLRKLEPSEYPDFAPAASAGNLDAVEMSIDQSLKYFQAKSTLGLQYLDIDHDRAVASLVALRQLVDNEIHNPANDGGKSFDAAVRSQFDIYQSIGGYNPDTGHYTGEVLFTAYYTPTYDASPSKTTMFQYPIYRRPANLVTPDADHAYVRTANGDLANCPTRREIEQQHALEGDELYWVADRFDAYIVTIQGSARLRMPDGHIVEIGYAGCNGYEYKGPGLKMVADGVISREKLSVQAMRDYFHAHPDGLDKYLLINDRDVFFTETRGGPFGCLGVPVTALATIATDRAIYPAGMPAMVVASIPGPSGTGVKPFTGLMMDQDRGGAIRSAGKCDIYMGLGEQAGRELNVGKLYYLAVKTSPTTAP